LNITLNQQLLILSKRIPEEKERLEEAFRKRCTIKRIYQKVLDFMSSNELKSASEEYFSLALKQKERRDYDTAGVLILLGTLCLMKLELELSVVRPFFDAKFLAESFSMKLLKLLMDAKFAKDNKIFDEVWSMMKVIPLFEEEKCLLLH
jgi:hypothetical protein